MNYYKLKTNKTDIPQPQENRKKHLIKLFLWTIRYINIYSTEIKAYIPTKYSQS